MNGMTLLITRSVASVFSRKLCLILQNFINFFINSLLSYLLFSEGLTMTNGDSGSAPLPFLNDDLNLLNTELNPICQ